MPTPPTKQSKQRALAWKLRVVMGAQGTLYPRESLPVNICITLSHITHLLKQVEQELRHELRNIK